MEHVSETIKTQLSNLEIEKMPEQTSSQKSLVRRSAATPEQEIIKRKYQSKQIGNMTPAEVNLWGQGLLLKIHVITGWEIPQGQLMEILVDQFQKKLVESYPDMNVDEIEYAFRHDTGVKDWGKTMNLALIDEVLMPYLGKRIRLGHELEERNLPNPPQRILTDEELYNEHRRDVEMFFQRLRKGWIPEKIPDYFKAILVRDKLIKQEENTVDFFVTRLGHGSENIYVPAL